MDFELRLQSFLMIYICWF